MVICQLFLRLSLVQGGGGGGGEGSEREKRMEGLKKILCLVQWRSEGEYF